MTRPLTSSAPRPTRHAAGGTVSSTSAQRFAARVRARRRRRWGMAVLGVAVLAGLLWGALRSPWATVERVEVTGTVRVDGEAVRAAAGSELGRSLLLARTGDVAERVRREQRLALSVTVTRSWPSTLHVAVVERVPVAAVPDADGVRLVDADGVVVDRAGSTPKGLPRVEVDLAGPGATQSLRACVAVARGLPAPLARRVKRMGAETPDRVWLELTDGARVEWGSGEKTARKASVLQALLSQKAEVYDVRSPDTPALRR